MKIVGLILAIAICISLATYAIIFAKHVHNHRLPTAKAVPLTQVTGIVTANSYVARPHRNRNNNNVAMYSAIYSNSPHVFNQINTPQQSLSQTRRLSIASSNLNNVSNNTRHPTSLSKKRNLLANAATKRIANSKTI